MEENGFMYYPKNYADAIRLALNGSIDDMEIHDFKYDEDCDMWYVDATDSEWGRINEIPLTGDLVRKCYHAALEGIHTWTDEVKIPKHHDFRLEVKNKDGEVSNFEIRQENISIFLMHMIMNGNTVLDWNEV